jgi:hypothetical protein
MKTAYRYNNDANKPANVDWTMWADSQQRVEYGYGAYGWAIDVSELPHIDDIDIASFLNADYDNGNLDGDLLDAVEAYGVAEVAAEYNPSNIVESAQAWDNADFVAWFWSAVAEPAGLIGIVTDDGAVLFDASKAYRV